MGNTIRIESIDDPRLHVYTSLTEHQLRASLEAARGLFIAESPLVVEAALDTGCVPLSFLCDEGHAQSYERLFARADAPVLVLAQRELEKVVGYRFNRGLLAAFERPAQPALSDLARNARRLVVLEDLVDINNVGSVMRSAAALGADGVVLSPRCADPLARRALRVSMGCALKLPWTRAEEGSWPDEAFAQLRAAGFASYAMALKPEALRLQDVAPTPGEKIALVFGNEAMGLTERTIAACDHTVVIPMANQVDSLNIAASSAIAMWRFFAT